LSDQTKHDDGRLDEGPEPSWAGEEKRLKAIRDKRRANQECVFCGKPLGFFDKLAKRTEHSKCDVFKE
jgi:hypothetical protein